MRAMTHTVAGVVFGKGGGAILGLLYDHPDRSFYYRQLTRELKSISVGTLQRELKILTQIGLIDRSTLGKQVFYQANHSHPVFPELRALLSKTVGLIHRLRSALAPLADRISVAFIYGSIARREERGESDVDLMVVGRAMIEDVLGKLAGTEASLRRAVNPTVYSVSDFKTKLSNGNHFLNSVIRGEKIFLIGDEDELRKVGGIRMAANRADQSR
jgi:predicted nucleotidyltransferase